MLLNLSLYSMEYVMFWQNGSLVENNLVNCLCMFIKSQQAIEISDSVFIKFFFDTLLILHLTKKLMILFQNVGTRKIIVHVCFVELKQSLSFECFCSFMTSSLHFAQSFIKTWWWKSFLAYTESSGAVLS